MRRRPKRQLAGRMPCHTMLTPANLSIPHHGRCAKFEALEEFEGVKRTCEHPLPASLVRGWLPELLCTAGADGCIGFGAQASGLHAAKTLRLTYPSLAGQRALAAHNLARQRRKARERGGVAPGSGRGTGSESSVSAPAAARSGAPAAASASAAVAAAAAAVGLAGAGASQAAAAAPPLGLRPASGSLFGSQQASVAGLGEEAAPAGLQDLLEVPALSSALWQAPGPAQQLAAAAPLAGPLLLAPALHAERLPLPPALLPELLGSNGGSLQADALHEYPTTLHLQQAQLAQQAQQAALLAQMHGHPMALMQHAQAQQALQVQQAQHVMAPMPPAPLPLLPYVSPGTVHRISLKVRQQLPWRCTPPQSSRTFEHACRGRPCLTRWQPRANVHAAAAA